MGYQAPKRIFKLVDFPASIGEGLVVRARSMKLGQLLDLQSIANLVGKQTTDLTEDDLRQTEQLFKMFAMCLVDWNLEDEDGNPVPPTYEGLKTQDFDWVNALIGVWMTSTVGVSDPLDLSSIGGRPSEALLIPMAPLTQSRAS